MGTQAKGAALLSAARVGGFAPSIHNTQPWRWRLVVPFLELRTDRERQLQATDPLGRMLTISCGAGLHHARVALAAGQPTGAPARRQGMRLIRSIRASGDRQAPR